jgi:hypothetical protein
MMYPYYILMDYTYRKNEPSWYMGSGEMSIAEK